MANTWGTQQATTISSTAIADAGSSTTGTINNNGKVSTEISVSVAYGGTATEGVFVYILREKTDGNFQDIDDNPYGFEMPSATSVTRDSAITVSGAVANSFQVLLTNDSGASVTATVDYRQAT